jgi:phosphoenolpyruvate carboxylase
MEDGCEVELPMADAERARRPPGGGWFDHRATLVPHVAKVEMVCAKADLRVARTYFERLGGEMALFDDLEREYRRTVAALLRVRRAEQLLSASPMLRSAIERRNPYVDPLSLLQISLLRRKRELAAEDPALDPINAILGTTLNGVAQGLRNTG